MLATVSYRRQDIGSVSETPAFATGEVLANWSFKGDENPEWTAAKIAQFIAEDGGIPSVDLSYLTNKVTLV